MVNFVTRNIRTPGGIEKTIICCGVGENEEKVLTAENSVEVRIRNIMGSSWPFMVLRDKVNGNKETEERKCDYVEIRGKCMACKSDYVFRKANPGYCPFVKR